MRLTIILKLSCNLYFPILSDSNKQVGSMARAVRSGINPAPTLQIKQRLAGGGFYVRPDCMSLPANHSD
jgi:hypothetical protein